MPTERKHLRRLDESWSPNPIYFVTTCTFGRTNRLANEDFHVIAREVWRNCVTLKGWSVGRYAVMPDHVHFFTVDARGDSSLSRTLSGNGRSGPQNTPRHAWASHSPCGNPSSLITCFGLPRPMSRSGGTCGTTPFAQAWPRPLKIGSSRAISERSGSIEHLLDKDETL